MADPPHIYASTLTRRGRRWKRRRALRPAALLAVAGLIAVACAAVIVGLL